MDSSQQKKEFITIIESEKLLDNRFSNIKSISEDGGDGFFSIVFTAIDERGGKEVVLKFYDPTKMGDSNRMKRFEREAKMLSLLKDESLVIDIIGDGIRNLETTFVHPLTKTPFTFKYPYIALMKADSNVADLIYSENGTDALALLYIFRQILKSVFRLHNRKICHRDLKPDNFLIKRSQVFLSDLGTSKIMNDSIPDIEEEYLFPVGHKLYLAPELYLTMGIADELVFRADIFALGAILFEMFTGSIYTYQIYDDSLLLDLHTTNEILSRMTTSNKVETYKRIADELSRKTKTPDIFSYNDAVPNCIKLQLNKLYKQLVEFNVFKRLDKHNSIFRQIDICIITLENELKYQARLKENKRRKLIRKQRKLIQIDRLRMLYLKSKGITEYAN